MSSVITADLIKQYLLLAGGTPTPTQDAVIGRLGDAVHAAIEQHLGRSLTPVEYDAGPYDGNGRNVLYLRHDPIISVESVSIEGSAKTVSDGTSWPLAQVVYTPGDSRVRLADGTVFPLGISNVLIAYTAGLDSPAALVQAGAQWAAQLFSTGRRSLTDADQVDTAPVPDFVKTELARYRRVVFP